MKRVLILGAAGRDFHNFNVVFRNNPEFHVVAFTATQIPDIAGRRYPAELAGDLYPDGIPILEENRMEEIIRDEKVDVVTFSYSDVAYATLMHLASRAVAAGADFWLLGAERTQLKSKVPVISICAVRTGCGKSPVSRTHCGRIAQPGLESGGDPSSHAVWRSGGAACAALRHAGRSRLHKCTIEEREEYEPHIIEGTPVYAGVDYETILRQAEQEGDVILWDGGNNDTSFYVPTFDHRGARSASCRTRTGLLSRRSQLPQRRCAHHQQGGYGRSRRHQDSASEHRTAQSEGAGHRDSMPRHAWPIPKRSPASGAGGGGRSNTYARRDAYGAGVVAANRYHASALVDPRPYAWAPSRRRSRSSRTCGECCLRWDTATRSGTSWKRPSSAYPATWCWWQRRSTWLAPSRWTSRACG